MNGLTFPQEPALYVGVATAVLDVLIAFGAPITGDQKTAVAALVTAVVAIIGAFVIRSQVTPVAKP